MQEDHFFLFKFVLLYTTSPLFFSSFLLFFFYLTLVRPKGSIILAGLYRAVCVCVFASFFSPFLIHSISCFFQNDLFIFHHLESSASIVIRSFPSLQFKWETKTKSAMRAITISVFNLITINWIELNWNHLVFAHSQIISIIFNLI